MNPEQILQGYKFSKEQAMELLEVTLQTAGVVGLEETHKRLKEG